MHYGNPSVRDLIDLAARRRPAVPNVAFTQLSIDISNFQGGFREDTLAHSRYLPSSLFLSAFRELGQ